MTDVVRIPAPDEMIERSIAAHRFELQRMAAENGTVRRFCRELIGFATWRRMQSLTMLTEFDVRVPAFLTGTMDLPNFLSELLSEIENQGDQS